MECNLQSGKQISLYVVVNCTFAQLGEELNRIKQEIEERGNSMSDGGSVTDMLPSIFTRLVYFSDKFSVLFVRNTGHISYGFICRTLGPSCSWGQAAGYQPRPQAGG